MSALYRKAFTLTELLIVVLVIGVLTAVAAPRFSRVLESRKTAEAAKMLSAVRVEQEKRCMLGKHYIGEENKSDLSVLASASKSSHYNYTLANVGAEAVSKSAKKAYTLKMLSYRDGRICCTGQCDGLKYEDCDTLQAQLRTGADECETEECDSCSCSAYAALHACECEQTAAACGCTESQMWNGTACVSACSDSAYAALHACECEQTAAACGCTADQIWNGTACVDLCVESTVAVGGPYFTVPGVDTCNGDVNAPFTCNGIYKGTCTDVYTSTSGPLNSSWGMDPFLSFRNSILLAQQPNVCGVGRVECDRRIQNGVWQYKCCRNSLCSLGCVWTDTPYEENWYLCENGVFQPTPCDLAFEPCKEPFVWSATDKACVCVLNSCPIGTQLNTTTCTCEEQLPLPPPVAIQYYTRQVTCCGIPTPWLPPGEDKPIACSLADKLACTGTYDDETCECSAAACPGECPTRKTHNSNCECVCSQVLECSGGTWNDDVCSCKYSAIDDGIIIKEECEELPTCGQNLGHGMIGECRCAKEILPVTP